jgi:hypothetical protein
MSKLKEKPKPEYSAASIEAGARALANHPHKGKLEYAALNFPTMVRLIFSCDQCGEGFPLEKGPRTFMSEEHARQIIREFSKDLEPRTIACSCGHEAEYHPTDVAVYVLPEK